MVRQKSRKTAEELYAVGPPPPPLNTTRFDGNFLQNSKPSKGIKASDKAETFDNAPNCRKKNKGGAEGKDEKTSINEERLLGRTAKPKKPDRLASPLHLDNKNLVSFVEETEKDEDTEEFLELIRETVENAVGKTLSDIFSRNFRDMNSKIEDLREQLNTRLEAKLEKLQTDMNNKIVHYGEENSRHFRYLCMKSEYDKMFYQHQNIMTSVPVDARPNLINPYPPNFANVSQSHHSQVPCQPTAQAAASRPQMHTSCDIPAPAQCNCHVHGFDDCGGGDPSKSSVSTKSSEMGIKEVKELLEQLQKFYEHQQPQKKQSGKEARGDIDLDIQDDSGDGDEDDSSENMSSPSIEEKLGAGGDS